MIAGDLIRFALDRDRRPARPPTVRSPCRSSSPSLRSSGSAKPCSSRLPLDHPDDRPGRPARRCQLRRSGDAAGRMIVLGPMIGGIARRLRRPDGRSSSTPHLRRLRGLHLAHAGRPSHVSAPRTNITERRRRGTPVRAERDDGSLIALLAAIVSLLCVWGPWETLVPFIVSEAPRWLRRSSSRSCSAPAAWRASWSGVFMAQRGCPPRRAPHRDVPRVGGRHADDDRVRARHRRVAGHARSLRRRRDRSRSSSSCGSPCSNGSCHPTCSDVSSSLDWMISIAGFAALVPHRRAGRERVRRRHGADLRRRRWRRGHPAFTFVPGARDPERDGSLGYPATASRPKRRRLAPWSTRTSDGSVSWSAGCASAP